MNVSDKTIKALEAKELAQRVAALEKELAQAKRQLASIIDEAIHYDKRPLALIATCKLCGEQTESFYLARMDPAPRHHIDCALVAKCELAT